MILLKCNQSFLILIRIIEYYAGREEYHSESFSSHEKMNPVVIQQSFLLPFIVRSMSITTTSQGITNKNLIFATHADQLVGVQKSMLSSRRPLPSEFKFEDEASLGKNISEVAFESSDLPKYDGVITFNPLMTFSYNLNVKSNSNFQIFNIDGISVFPSKMESTSLVFTYGHDVYFTRIAPEKNFDMLNEDFSYALLFLTMAVLFLATVVSAIISKQKKLKELFLLR
jgi:hypothetical protein